MWAIEKNIWITAAHIPGIYNVEADEESRVFREDRQWALNPTFFEKLCKRFFTPDLDLFATRINTKLPRFHSWLPDPEAEVIDTFSVSWGGSTVYAFPPFCLIGRVLQKIRMEGVEGIVVVPDWPTKCWYTMLNRMLIAKPWLLPVSEQVLYLPCRETRSRHPLTGRMALRICHVTGDASIKKVTLKG